MNLRQPPEWLSDGTLAPPPGVGAALSLLSGAQRLGMWWRSRQPRTRVNAQVISLGNITAGGTGKTPAVIERAQREVAAGRNVAVITRGYGSRPQDEPFLIAPESPLSNLALLIGDEPALIQMRVPQVWIVKSADRVAGARAAIDAGCDCLILDDGFQSLALERDEDIVLVDAAHPLGNGHLIPRGTLREPAEALRRATEVWLTRCDAAADLASSIALVTQHHGKPPARLTKHAPEGFWRMCDGSVQDLGLVKDKKVVLACGIARPQAFERTIAALGAHIYGRLYFRDHERFTDHDLPLEGMVIVTEKDAVRFSTQRQNIHVLRMGLQDFSPM